MYKMSDKNHLIIRTGTVTSFPSTTTHIYCYINDLTSLPELPATLEVLHLENSHVSFIPALPSSVTLLACVNNNLC